MTYKELAEYILNKMTEEQQLSDITLYNSILDEFFSATLKFSDSNCDILDLNHPYFEQK